MTSFNTGTTASNGGGSTSVSITIPAGVRGGDFVLTAVAQFNTNLVQVITASSTGTAPTQIGSTVSTASFSSNVCNGALFYFVAVASDAGKVMTFTTQSGFATSQFAVALGAWTGANNVTPVDVSGSATATGASSTITCPSETTGVANDWDLQIITAALGGATFTGGTGFTQREAVSDASSGATAAIYDSNASVGPAGTIIGGAAFANAGHNNWWIGWTVGLAPAPAVQAKGAAQQTPDDKTHTKKLFYLLG